VVLRAALRLIDRDGFSALSMRTLAEQMGIGVMTLYGYVRTRRELLDGVGALILDPVGAVAPHSRDWRKDLATSIRELHTVLHAHPGGLELLLHSANSGPAFDRVRNLLLGALRRAGLSRRETVHATTALVSFTVGFTLTELHRARNAPSKKRGGQTARGPQFEFLRDVQEEYAEHTSADAFEYGLRHLLQGINR
jgi:AcrR family transcriptional regulator